MKIQEKSERNNISVEFVNPLNSKKSYSQILPTGADPEHIKTLYENGLLKIRAPRRAS